MWPDASEIQRLLDEARHGDVAAVDRLLSRHREPLRQAIRLRLDTTLARRVDASDVVQDVLLEASRRLDDYLRKPTMPFHLWLRHLARDHVIDAHRRHRVAQRRSLDREQPLQSASPGDQSSLDAAAAVFVDQELTPASAAIRHEMQRRFESALAELDDGDREVIVLRHFEHLSNQEVAALLQLSDAAASMRYLRAVRKLRTALGPASDSAGDGDFDGHAS